MKDGSESRPYQCSVKGKDGSESRPYRRSMKVIAFQSFIGMTSRLRFGS